MKKNLLSLLTLTVFLSGCSINNERTLESEIDSELESDAPIDKRSKFKMEVGGEVLSQVPDDYLLDYYKAVINYRFLFKQQNTDPTELDQAKKIVYKTLNAAMLNTQGHKISYDKAKAAMQLSRISASVKNPQDETEMFRKIFQLPNSEAAGILRFILEAIQKGL